MKFFLAPLLFLSLSLGGCGLVQSLVDGAKAEATTPAGTPLPPAPPGDSSALYWAGAVLATLGLGVADRLTGGVVSKSTIGGLVAVLSQHVDALASAVPADVHAQTIQGLANSHPVITTSPIAPAPVPATS